MSPVQDKPFLYSVSLAAGGFLMILVLLATVGATVSDLNEAGKAAYALGDYSEAERVFSQASAQAPEDPLLHYHRAVALTRLHRWKEASEAYEAVLRLDPPPELAAAAREGFRTVVPLTRTRSDPGDSVVSLRWTLVGWVTDVVLNDTKTARFLVDTGAGLCVISPELAGVLGNDPGPGAPSVTLQTLSGTTTGPLVTIPILRVGDAEARDVRAVIHEPPPGIDGILGNSFLSRYTVTLDPKEGVLSLRSQ
ncbi:MAG: aspartyl protease family protein [candidate division NC10 bacterium]